MEPKQNLAVSSFEKHNDLQVLHTSQHLPAQS